MDWKFTARIELAELVPFYGCGGQTGLLGTLFVCLQFSNQISSLIHLMAFQSNGKGNLWTQAGAALSDTSCPGLTFSIIHYFSSLGILFFFNMISSTTQTSARPHLELTKCIFLSFLIENDPRLQLRSHYVGVFHQAGVIELIALTPW